MAIDRIVINKAYELEKSKELYYEQATQKLLATVNNLNLDKLTQIRTRSMTLIFRESFKLKDVQNAAFGDKAKFFSYYSDGFCRVSSINFAQIMNQGQNKPIWSVMYIDELWTYGPHHYLMHIPTKTIFDLTYDQYTNHNIEIPYYLGSPLPEKTLKQESKHETVIRFANAIGLSYNKQ